MEKITKSFYFRPHQLGTNQTDIGGLKFIVLGIFC